MKRSGDFWRPLQTLERVPTDGATFSNVDAWYVGASEVIPTLSWFCVAVIVVGVIVRNVVVVRVILFERLGRHASNKTMSMILPPSDRPE